MPKILKQIEIDRRATWTPRKFALLEVYLLRNQLHETSIKNMQIRTQKR